MIPSGYVNTLAIDIVDLPFKHGGSFHGYVSLPEGNLFTYIWSYGYQYFIFGI